MREILCFGDSNTYGLIPGTENRFDRNTRWTGILDKHLYAKNPDTDLKTFKEIKLKCITNLNIK